MAPDTDPPQKNEHWQAINRIFDAAVGMNATRRAAFVATESAGDTRLQHQVELLLNAHDRAGSWMSNAAVIAPIDNEPVSPGDVLCDRFVVRRAIASGGMGTVYEALDQALDTPVALKIIRQDIAHDPEVLDRFRREVAVARRLTHKNLCRTFDLEKTDHRGKEIVFLTMEFLPGITLAQRLSTQGALPADEVLRIARSVAEALQAAHVLGVVHRDIKPANIMLVGDSNAKERVVVTDFGLARGVSAAQDAAAQHDVLTRSGLPIGTLSYMAPEQLEGKSATVATDVYALGLVIVEMLTGKRVFATRNSLSGLAERLHKAARLTAALPPDAPPGWSAVLERSLQTDPARRQQSALALMEELGLTAARKQSSISRMVQSARSASTAEHKKRGVAVLAIVLLVAVALSVTAFRLLRVERNSILPQGSIVYLTPMKNESGARELDHAGTLLATGLSQSSHVNLLDESRIAETLSAMKHPAGAPVDATTAREVALRSGAARVVLGLIEKSGTRYALRVDIQQPDNDPSRYRTHWTKSFAWTASADGVLSDDALSAIRDAGDWIRESVGESESDIARLNVPPEDATTASWQALEEYSHAEELRLAGRTEDGIVELQRATEQDHNFSLAYARLGDALFSRERRTEGLAAYRQAMITTDRQRLTRRELDHVRGIYASDTGDDATAEAQFHDLEVFYPNDWLAWFYRGTPLRNLGRIPEAMECLKRAHALAPKAIGPIGTLAMFAMQEGDLSAAEQWIKELRTVGAKSEAIWMEGDVALLQGDLHTAEKNYRTYTDGPPSARTVRGDQLLSRLAAEQGHMEQSINLLNAGMTLAEARGDRGSRTQMQMDRAWLECNRGEMRACLNDAGESLKADPTPHGIRLMTLLVLHSLPQATASQRSTMADLLEAYTRSNRNDEIGPVFDMARLGAQGTVQLLKGRCTVALKAFRAEAAADAPMATQEYLALALEECIRQEHVPSAKAALMREAAQAYAAGAFRPALIWQSARFHSPATMHDQLAGWLRNTDERSSRFQDARLRLQQFRPDESPIHPTSTAAPFAASTSTLHVN